MPFPHWEYFLALESDLEETSRYVEFTEDNFDVYSVEFARILLASASEVDVVAKIICNAAESDTDHEYMNQYRATLLRHLPGLADVDVSLPRYGLTLTPWSAFSDDKSPDWWKKHQKVKHYRDEYYPEANLKNATNAVTALFALVLLLYGRANRDGLLAPLPRLVSSPLYTVPPNPSNVTQKQLSFHLHKLEEQQRRLERRRRRDTRFGLDLPGG